MSKFGGQEHLPNQTFSVTKERKKARNQKKGSGESIQKEA